MAKEKQQSQEKPDHKELYISIAALVISLIAIPATHWSTLTQIEQEKRKEVRVQFLSEAYSLLVEASNRKPDSSISERQRVIYDKIERAVMLVGCYGDDALISEANKFVDSTAAAIAKAGNGRYEVDVNGLRDLLRSQLRLEAGLGESKSAPKFIRLYDGDKPASH